jgi:hypothetical protein
MSKPRGPSAKVEPTSGRILLSLDLPLRLRSAANLREHWAEKARRIAQHRMLGRYAMVGISVPPRGLLRCRLTRIGPRRLDDDNLAAAFKGLRDGIAQAAGIDDGDARWAWVYTQEVGEYAVSICLSVEP